MKKKEVSEMSVEQLKMTYIHLIKHSVRCMAIGYPTMGTCTSDLNTIKRELVEREGHFDLGIDEIIVKIEKED